MAGFQKTNFGVSSAFGAGNTKIGFIMRITDMSYDTYSSNPKKRERRFAPLSLLGF